MAINLDDPKRFRTLAGQAHQVAMNMLRPISRKYDRAEHEYPKELDMLAAMIDGLSESGAAEGAGAAGVKRDVRADDKAVKNGANMASVLSIQEMCWGDVGLLLSMPRQGLGNSAIASVADDEQQQRFAGVPQILQRCLGAPETRYSTVDQLHRDLVRLADQRLVLLGGLQVDHQTSTPPSITPMARRSRYHRSTGCSLTNP